MQKCKFCNIIKGGAGWGMYSSWFSWQRIKLMKVIVRIWGTLGFTGN